VKSVCVIVVVAVSLHHQQRDNFCKMQKENAKWTGAIIYAWCFIVLRSPRAIYTCVYAVLPWEQEGHVHCRITACWVCSPGPLSSASSQSEPLNEIELLDSWQLAVWQYSWGCDIPGTLSEPPSPEMMLLDFLAS
jgi:hypothetical protein